MYVFLTQICFSHNILYNLENILSVKSMEVLEGTKRDEERRFAKYVVSNTCAHVCFFDKLFPHYFFSKPKKACSFVLFAWVKI